MRPFVCSACGARACLIDGPREHAAQDVANTRREGPSATLAPQIHIARQVSAPLPESAHPWLPPAFLTNPCLTVNMRDRE
jgi:hypothetical protein